MPWTQFLPEGDRRSFLADFAITASGCVETGVFEPLARLSREWRATAAVYADPRLLATPTGPADADESFVPLPPA
jgi:hypothetical protein